MFYSEHTLTVIHRPDGSWAGTCRCGWQVSGDQVLELWHEHANGRS